MDAQFWIAIAIVVFTIISSITKGLRKSKQQVAQPIQVTIEPDTLVEEDEDAAPKEGVSNLSNAPVTPTVTTLQDENEALQEQPTNETLEIDLTDANEARRAFIASEILNKKY